MKKNLLTLGFIVYAISLIWLCATRMDLIIDAIATLTIAILVAPIVLIVIAFILKAMSN